MDIIAILLRRIQDMGTDFVRILPQLGIALILLVATYFIAKSARRIAERLLSRTDLRGTWSIWSRRSSEWRSGSSGS